MWIKDCWLWRALFLNHVEQHVSDFRWNRLNHNWIIIRGFGDQISRDPHSQPFVWLGSIFTPLAVKMKYFSNRSQNVWSIMIHVFWECTIERATLISLVVFVHLPSRAGRVQTRTFPVPEAHGQWHCCLDADGSLLPVCTCACVRVGGGFQAELSEL